MKKFNIIVAASKNYIIGKNNTIPWHYKEDFKYFKRITSKSSKGKKNIIMMGMNTFKSIGKPLPGRINMVFNRNVYNLEKRNDNLYYVPDHYIDYDKFHQIIRILDNSIEHDKIFVIGGDSIYKKTIKSTLLDKVYLTKINKKIEGDRFFPRLTNDFDLISVEPGSNKDLNFNIYKKRSSKYDWKYEEPYTKKHQEYQYHDLIKKILNEGNICNERTGTGIKSIFGTQMQFDISRHIPLLTTKKMFTRGIIEELLWFLRGETNNKTLQEKDVHIWDGNTSREFLDDMGFIDRKEGDGGPIYGFQFRHFGADYIDSYADYTGKGIDQVSNVINLIKNNPDSRRMVINLWNPCDLDRMVLPPCHVLYQFRVYGDKLSCSMYQRSGDVGLGVPFNIVSASVMTHIFAHLTGKKPGKLVHTIGDAHIYLDHEEQLKKQIEREPYSFPLFEIKDRGQKEVEDFHIDDFLVKGYEHWPGLKMKMAV